MPYHSGRKVTGPRPSMSESKPPPHLPGVLERGVRPPILVNLCEVTKHTRRIPRCHTSRRYILGDNAACTNDGVAADVDAGKNDRLAADPDMVFYDDGI